MSHPLQGDLFGPVLQAYGDAGGTLRNEDLYGLSERVQWTPRVDSKLLVKEMSVSE